MKLVFKFIEICVSPNQQDNLTFHEPFLRLAEVELRMMAIFQAHMQSKNLIIID